MSYMPAVAAGANFLPISDVGMDVTMRQISLLTNSNQNSGISTTWPTANKAILYPFRVAAPTRIGAMIASNGTVVSGNLDMGIYTLGGSRIVSTGSTAQAGVSTIQAIAITPTTLLPGEYYAALALDNATGTFLAFAPPIAALCRAIGMAEATTSFPLPASISLAAITSAYIPVFGTALSTTV